MESSVPHPIPYQGSKRRLATAILSHMPDGQYTRLVEPFAGSAAVTLAAAHRDKFPKYILSDRLASLVQLWHRIITNPADTANEYEKLWLRERERPIEAFYDVRAEFNVDRSPAKLLYLLARCVKNAVRFNPSGDFNQSPDKRRKGTQPSSMRASLYAAHSILAGRSEAACVDFMEMFEGAKEGDLFYLDPPYQGTSESRDSRYISGVTRERMVEGLELLKAKGIPFILSYDGSCGDKTYGDRLPLHLASRLLLNVGRSSQATLNGQDHTTVESLYISHELLPVGADERLLTLDDFAQQRSMVFA